MGVKEDVYAYVDFLRGRGYYVTLHTQLLSDAEYYARNIHCHPFCLAVKTNREIWNTCIACQAKVRRRCQSGELFFGVCHAGVGEYVLPLGEADPGGFVSVSGYYGDKTTLHSRIRRLCETFGENESRLLALAEATLTRSIPPADEIRALAMPIKHMVALASKEAGATGGAQEEAVLAELLVFLEGHCHETVPLAELALRLHCSESYLSHLFRKRIGVSIGDYRTRLRLDKAARLLSGSGFRVGEIAYMVGYGDANYFSALFRRHFGASPREYRAGNQTTSGMVSEASPESGTAGE